MKFVSVVVLGLILATAAFAQNNGAPTGTSSAVISSPSSFFSNPSLMAGVKSYNDGGRPQDVNTAGGKQFKSKNEFFLGAKLQSGFGLYGQIVETGEVYSEFPVKAKSVKVSGMGPRDPSATFVHPIYSDDRLSVTGAAREYFPVSDRSVSQGIYQQAYYVNLLYKAKYGLDLFNQLVPRYYSQMKYKPTDGVFYTEDWTTVSKLVKPWLRVGFGQHYQLETHNDTPVGQTLELFPYADIVINKTVFFGPRLYVPAAVQNTVYDAPSAVSANNIQAELYFQATL